MQFRCSADAVSREQKKAAAGLVQAGVLLAVALLALFSGVVIMPWFRGRLSILMFIGSFGSFSMAAAALNWALDARKTATWMADGRVHLEPHGLRVQGLTHPWSTMRVEACTGTELLILEEGGMLKIPIDSLEKADVFRQEVRKNSRGGVNI